MDLFPISIFKILKENGWQLDRIRGSRHIFVKIETRQTLPVPVHGNKDLKLGTYKGILKMAGIEVK